MAFNDSTNSPPPLDKDSWDDNEDDERCRSLLSKDNSIPGTKNSSIACILSTSILAVIISVQFILLLAGGHQCYGPTASGKTETDFSKTFYIVL